MANLDALAYLRARMAAEIQRWERPHGTERDLALSVAELRGIAEGLVALGALTDEVVAAALVDFHAAVRASSSASADAALSIAAPVQEHVDRPGVERHAGPRRLGPHPVAVIALIPHTFELAGVQYFGTSIEVWSEFFVVRLGATSVPPDEFGLGGVEITIFDNVGTRYVPGSRGSSGGAHVTLIDCLFSPAPPAAASSLTLLVRHPRSMEEEEFSIPIGSGT